MRSRILALRTGTSAVSDRVGQSNSTGRQFIARLILTGLLLALGITTPAAGLPAGSEAGDLASMAAEEQNPLCRDGAGSLATFVESAVQLTTGLGMMLLLVVWQGSAVLSMITVGREQKAQLKEYKRGAFRSAGVLLVSGPLFTLGGSMMGLPIAQCVDLVPF